MVGSGFVVQKGFPTVVTPRSLLKAKDFFKAEPHERNGRVSGFSRIIFRGRFTEKIHTKIVLSFQEVANIRRRSHGRNEAGNGFEGDVGNRP